MQTIYWQQRTAVFFLLFLLLCGGGLAVAAETDAQAPEYTWTSKLKRGALNVISSPVEIARSIQITSNEQTLLHGWTVGLVKGLGSAVVRLGAGVVDILTCPFDFPDENKGPLVKPEYVWEKEGVRYS
ncbi:MAG: hypothetical protein A2Z83_07700 [Omnitrophica bacterium GWA2_52_8]|nr:MAG: hypothetical protein A2Z83_07700 [Omnitrophica bacterium GWA2_52_8]